MQKRLNNSKRGPGYRRGGWYKIPPNRNVSELDLQVGNIRRIDQEWCEWREEELDNAQKSNNEGSDPRNTADLNELELSYNKVNHKSI